MARASAQGSIIAAGTLIPEGTIVEPRSLWMGVPGKMRKQLSDEDQETILRYGRNYQGYREAVSGRDEKIVSGCTVVQLSVCLG